MQAPRKVVSMKPRYERLMRPTIGSATFAKMMVVMMMMMMMMMMMRAGG